ncbi:MAG: hypothetical protein HYY18_21465 [Planctomycetes bacterium]|nr:hypothetical protein [Planctomycetota bacterium]
MKRVRFEYAGPAPELAGRQLMGEAVADFHRRALPAEGGAAEWIVRLGGNLMFDAGGLRLLAEALDRYQGRADRLEFHLVPDPIAARDYYGLQAGLSPDGTVRLPAAAVRAGREGSEAAAEPLCVTLPSSVTPIPFPRSLTAPTDASTPHALLLACDGDFDLLFANQIAWPAELRRRVPRSPGALLRAALRRHPRDARMRAACAYRCIDRTAEVHTTAVVEGSVVGPGARIGAHCTVRFSVVGAGACLHDGAKVEFSTVGRGSWLMHDLVLFRCHVEDEVFLIHGPYQFSCFHSRSAAFATILMDWLPNGGPFKVMTPRGLIEYRGRFLGSVYREGARTLGGSLLAPGRIVPANTWLSGDPAQVHRRLDPNFPQGRPVPPAGGQPVPEPL